MIIPDRFSIGYLITGMLFILVSVPLVLQKIPPNTLYGVKIPKAFKSTELWYKVNTAGGWIMIAYGALTVVIGLVLVVGGDQIALSPASKLIGLVVLPAVAVIHLLIVCDRIQ